MGAAMLDVGTYEEIEAETKVPWWFTGLIHGMECSFSLNKHLHNGDSLKARTWQVPAGRPKEGSPPFTFVESACDALSYDHFAGQEDWGLAIVLYRLERYNGFVAARVMGSGAPGLSSSEALRIVEDVAERILPDGYQLDWTAQALQERVAELGAQITRDYAGRAPLLVGVLKGALMFMSDLSRAIELPVEFDFMAVSSYGSATRTSGVASRSASAARPVADHAGSRCA